MGQRRRARDSLRCEVDAPSVVDRLRLGRPQSDLGEAHGGVGELDEDDRFGAEEVVVAEEFLDRFTRRRRSPADELGPLLLDGDWMFDRTRLELSVAGRL